MPALHLACALARNRNDEVILLRLISVGQPSYLGTKFANTPPTEQEYEDIREYVATAEDYGVVLTLHDMQCLTRLEALADAADELEVDTVFAHIPKSRIPYWQKFQAWSLKRRLDAGHRHLFTLDNAPQYADEVPHITVNPVQMSPTK